MEALANRWLIGAIVVISLGVGMWLRGVYDPEWYRPSRDTHELRPWMVEADCYHRMYRVKRILEGKGLIQRFHPHENWPDGLIPSTTAPLDYCILALYFPIKLFGIKYPLDWAGVLISPLIWVALALFWGLCPLKHWSGIARMILVVSTAVLPGEIWATAFGRPDHQSLIFALFGFLFTAEYERWGREGRARDWWNIAAGIGWGVVIWTSLFEPLVLVLFLISFNVAVRWNENARFLIAMGTVLLVAMALEGVHVFVPPKADVPFLENWGRTIGELQPLSTYTFLTEFSLFVLLLPVVAILVLRNKKREKTDYLIVCLTFFLVSCSLMQLRWLYYGTLAELLLTARWLTIEGTVFRRIGLSLFIACLGFSTWQGFQTGSQQLENQPSPEEALIAQSIDGPGGVLAPWWLSGGIGYFSDQPIVTGSSHCGIEGNMFGALFYATNDWRAAEAVLIKRKIRWIVVYDDEIHEYPELNTSRALLGYTPLPYPSPLAEQSVSQQLVHIEDVSRQFQLRSVTPHLKLYEFVPEPSKASSQ